MWPMHQQSLILLHPTLKEKTHLQEHNNMMLTLGSSLLEMLPSALNIMWHMHLQRLNELYVKRFSRRCILQEIQYLTIGLHLGVKVTQNVAQYPLHHAIYSATKFKVATSNRYLTFDLDLRVKVTWNISQYPLNHVTYSGIKLEVATSNHLGGDSFARNYIIWPLTFDLEIGVKVTWNVAYYPLRPVTYSV